MTVEKNTTFLSRNSCILAASGCDDDVEVLNCKQANIVSIKLLWPAEKPPKSKVIATSKGCRLNQPTASDSSTAALFILQSKVEPLKLQSNVPHCKVNGSPSWLFASQDIFAAFISLFASGIIKSLQWALKSQNTLYKVGNVLHPRPWHPILIK